MARVIEISTPLGEDLLFHAMHAREELGRLSDFQIDLLSPKGDIDLNGMLGKAVSVTIALPEDQSRYFNGHVTRFSQQGMYGRYHRYAAVVKPWTWFLTRTADCRIFQEMTVPDIVKKVFADQPLADFVLDLGGTYRKWNYCVQYRETDFNFISRLLEHEGIYYYFKHTAGKHTMVLTDGSHKPYPKYDSLPFIPPERMAGRPDIEHISSWDLTREVQPGLYVHDDYDFERPSVDIRSKKGLPREYAPSTSEVFDYPGYYMQKPHGEQYAAVRIEEFGTEFEAKRAVTNARGLSVGYQFTLSGFPRDDQNKKQLVVSATYDLEFSGYEGLPNAGGVEYHCTFTAIGGEQFRPKRITPKPFVQGPQTAVVVGPGGDEIFTDKYGRVKVQFHWDRLGKKDENSSCWIRVSHPWAGKNWGAIATPRIGQEVIVDFLEGDPDQPIITGRVYNAEQMPPYALPANMTQTGIKSRSSKGGTPDNFNEIRFEDKKGSEQLFIHAEKNQDIEVENDETHWVGHDRTKTIDHDETTHVKHDRTETVDNNEKITIGANRTESVAKDETIGIGGNRTESVAKNESISIGKSRSESVADNETVSVGKDQSLDVGANRALTVAKNEAISIGDSRTDDIAKNEQVSVGKDRKVQIGENDMLQVGKKLLMTAGDEVTIKTGSASITMKKDGTITITGKDITLDGSGKINIKASSDVVIKGSKVSQN